MKRKNKPHGTPIRADLIYEKEGWPIGPWKKETFDKTWYCDGCHCTHDPGERWIRESEEEERTILVIMYCGPSKERLAP